MFLDLLYLVLILVVSDIINITLLNTFINIILLVLAPFIIQFLVLSGCLGIPFFSLQLCLGQQMCAGPLDMWRISPIFRGVGIALLFGHALLGVYTIMPVSWMFTFFRDSFITKLDRYRWAEPFDLYRECKH